MALLTNQFLRDNKVNGKIQRIVMFCGSEHIIDSITEDTVILKEVSRKGSSKLKVNSGICSVINDGMSTERYLENRVIR
jgi:hypothetical protein